MTRARAKALHDKVNSLLITLDLGTFLDGMLLTADYLCVIRYIHQEPPQGSQDVEMQPRREEEDEPVAPWPVLPPATSGTTG